MHNFGAILGTVGGSLSMFLGFSFWQCTSYAIRRIFQRFGGGADDEDDNVDGSGKGSRTSSQAKIIAVEPAAKY